MADTHRQPIDRQGPLNVTALEIFWTERDIFDKWLTQRHPIDTQGTFFNSTWDTDMAGGTFWTDGDVFDKWVRHDACHMTDMGCKKLLEIYRKIQ